MTVRKRQLHRCRVTIHVLLRAKVPLKSRTQSVDSDALDINWQSVFNHAHDHSLLFEAGDTLPHGRISASLQAVTSVGGNGNAGGVIRQAVESNELNKTDEGYEIERDGPGTGDIRQSLRSRLREGIQNGENQVIKSPTSSGKTYSPSTTRWRSHPETTGDQPVILFSGTTDARDDALAKSQDSWASPEVLYGREDACPLARGDYDSGNGDGNTPISAPDGGEPSEWFKTMCDDRGMPVSVAHSEFERAHNGDLPCNEDSGGCLSSTQWADIPRNDECSFDYDILHATHPFARVPQLINDCNLIIDERPDFDLDMETGVVRDKVKSYLREIDAPIRTWESLMVRIRDPDDSRIHQLQDALETPDTEWFRNDSDAHALTPGIIEALVTAEKRTHDRWVGETRYTYPTLIPNYDGPEHEVILRVVFDDENTIRVLQEIPDFSEARTVIGLDAHPTIPKWKAYTLPSIKMKQIVDSGDLHKWRRNQRNLRIVQVENNKNTWTKKDFNDNKVKIICDELRQKYGDEFRTAVTAMRFEQQLVKHLRNVGVDDPDTIHFGNEKSVEDFDSELVGLVAGCISPSSESIKDWIALLCKEADPKRENVSDYQGQEWVGPDAEVAEEILADVQEKGVLQACGRYARSPQEPDDGATVYVMTNVLSENYIDRKIENIRVFGPKQKQILEYIADLEGKATVNEITDNVDAGKRHVYDTVRELSEKSLLEIDGGGNSNLYYANRSRDGYLEV